MNEVCAFFLAKKRKIKTKDSLLTQTKKHIIILSLSQTTQRLKNGSW